MRLLLLSDTHIPKFLSYEEFEGLVSYYKSRVDFILHAGDLIDFHAKNAKELFEKAKKLVDHLAPGNHEVRISYEQKPELVKLGNMSLLILPYTSLFEELPEKVDLLLIHMPDESPFLPEYRLRISGHKHSFVKDEFGRLYIPVTYISERKSYTLLVGERRIELSEPLPFQNPGVVLNFHENRIKIGPGHGGIHALLDLKERSLSYRIWKNKPREIARISLEEAFPMTYAQFYV